jgi:hypothetical protein
LFRLLRSIIRFGRRGKETKFFFIVKGTIIYPNCHSQSNQFGNSSSTYLTSNRLSFSTSNMFLTFIAFHMSFVFLKFIVFLTFIVFLSVYIFLVEFVFSKSFLCWSFFLSSWFEQQKHEIEIKLIDCGKPNHSFKIGQESLIPLSKFGFGVKVEKCEIFSQIR